MISPFKWLLAPALILVLGLPLRSALPATSPTVVSNPPAQATYTIDPAHSSAKFEVEHLFVSSVAGQFGDLQGSILMDSVNPGNSRVDVSIGVDSISTQWAKRDQDLKSDHFFDQAKYPKITFKSTGVTVQGPGQLLVTGDLTLHGVTRSITIPVSQKGPFQGMQPTSLVVGFKGDLKLNRSDYGMTFMKGPVGDQVDITLNVEAHGTTKP